MNPTPLTADIAATLGIYEHRYGPPSGRADFLFSALETGRPLTSRHDVPVHVTCGVIVRNPQSKVLQVHHRALDRWLFPGGHLEAGDESLIAAARRELAEETGIVPAAAAVHPVPIDIDVHAIPANDAKGEPEHYHADFRYLVDFPDGDIRLQEAEVTEWRWIDADHLDNRTLAARLATGR